MPLNIRIPSSTNRLPRDYAGPVFISDIDKTYLATQIDSLAGLLRAAFETAERKTNVPGFSIVLRAVRRGAGPEAAHHPLLFVSASPPQLERRLLNKMELDGVEHDGIVFKDQLEHVRSRAFGKLTEQIAYKLEALLELWFSLPQQSQLYLFGDDSESDAVIYSLFADILAKRASENDLVRLLRMLGVFREDALRVAMKARLIDKPIAPVKAIFINLETGSQPSYYSRFGSLLYPTENTLQSAFVLFEKKLIREQAVKSICREMIVQHDFTPRELARGVESCARRGFFSIQTLDGLWGLLHEAGLFPTAPERKPQEGASSVVQLGGVKRTARRPFEELVHKYLDWDRH